MAARGSRRPSREEETLPAGYSPSFFIADEDAHNAARAAEDAMARKSTSSPPKKPNEELLRAAAELQEQLENQHLQSCGKQILSKRATQPSHEFAYRSTQDRHTARVGGTMASFRSWKERDPSSKCPGPGAYNVPIEPSTPSVILKDWGNTPRFLEDNNFDKKELTKHQLRVGPAARKYAAALGKCETDPAKVKYARRPAWAFCSSGLGTRFGPGVHFSKKAPLKTNSRLLDFRQLRDGPMTAVRSIQISRDTSELSLTLNAAQGSSLEK